jgi:hypothetical protein
MKPELREQIFQRSGGYCEACGGSLEANWAAHHRLLRSRGGKDSVTNLVALHHKCHNLSRPSVHLDPAWATERGLMCPSWEDPACLPLTLPSGVIVLLTDDGGYATWEGTNNE